MKILHIIRKWTAIFILSIISAGLLTDSFAEDFSKSKPKKEQH